MALFLEKREKPPPAGSVPSEQGQSRFLGSPGGFLYIRLHRGDVRVLCCIYMVRNLHVCDCILVLRMVLLF